MKAILCLALAAASVATVRGDPPARAPAQTPAADLASRFSLIGENYKNAVVLPESIFNPFKVQAATGLPGAGRKDAAGASNESIADAVEHHRVSGILLAPNPADNRVILGDQVFGIGDPIEFFDKDKGVAMPLAMGANVVLREIKRDSLVLDVGIEGEAPHRVDFPLRTFWRP
jgi:hypothetical protein